MGRLNILVNNADISRMIPHADLPQRRRQSWHEVHRGRAASSDGAAEPLLRARPPACPAGMRRHAGVRLKGVAIPYAASKIALNHITRLLALSLAPDIRVNAVAPAS
jgi:NAD(P)-dependent dehydrogenase (short-subunit alcohol dehydrogenase family)